MVGTVVVVFAAGAGASPPLAGAAPPEPSAAAGVVVPSGVVVPPGAVEPSDVVVPAAGVVVDGVVVAGVVAAGVELALPGSSEAGSAPTPLSPTIDDVEVVGVPGAGAVEEEVVEGEDDDEIAIGVPVESPTTGAFAIASASAETTVVGAKTPGTTVGATYVCCGVAVLVVLACLNLYDSRTTGRCREIWWGFAGALYGAMRGAVGAACNFGGRICGYHAAGMPRLGSATAGEEARNAATVGVT